jgi:peroxiredoxin
MDACHSAQSLKLSPTRFKEPALNPPDAQPKPSLYAVFLHLCLLALGGLVLVLAHENRQLKQSPSAALEPTLAVGRTVAPLALRHLDGFEETLAPRAAGRDRLLLVFTTTCAACQANQPTWRALQERAGGSVDVVGVSLDDLEATRTYQQSHRLSFPVTVPVDPQQLTDALAVTAVPLTVRLGADGRVQGSWVGGLTEAQLDEITALPADGAEPSQP